ncbi:MAG: DUF3789 domain-containing protein [Ruminococcus flavefaciens]|nr:DUF3789 domain-containing protein [Ruminococcus flavefaciens]MCM1058666.1 DUF3789 domain-containing protein [Eubacterium sp.]
MLLFILGCVLGATIGFFAASLCSAAKQDDESDN